MSMLFIFSILMILSVFTTKIGSRFGIPLLLIFMLIGIIFGSDVLNLFYFDDALLTKRVADILLIFILFDGGYSTTRAAFRRVAGPALTLATLGVVLTAFVLGFFVHHIFHLPFLESMMIASIIASTDAAAVYMITRQNPIKSKLATTIEVESAANDPMAILLTLAFINLLTIGGDSYFQYVLNLVWQFMGGVLVGFVMSKISVYLFDHLKSENRGNYNVLMVGLILLGYGAADLIAANGIIAVFFMGYWLGNSEFTGKQGASNFVEGITTLSNVALFLMLGLLVFPSNFVNIWKEGLIMALVLTFVARPVAVFLSLIPFKYTFKEQTFISWGGIKGAVAVVLATYPYAANLDQNGIVFDIIFFVVLVSCLVQGMSLGKLSQLFNFTAERPLVSPYTVELHTTKKSDVDMYEIHIAKDARAIDKSIATLGLGSDMVISSIIRDEAMLIPSGRIVLQEGDILFVLAHSYDIDRVNQLLNDPEAEPEPEPEPAVV
ncbi:MAG: potassium/proton antiporter [bacterium]|nr:potassium/proton antiporter [bacterium]